MVRTCLRQNHPGPYQIQAIIAAVHAGTPTAAATDWSQIVRLYVQLLARLGRGEEAAAAYRDALSLASNGSERRHIQARLRASATSRSQ